MEWYTLYKGGSGEYEEKKSRFIATIEPVSSEEEAAAFIAAMKKKYWDARHNCSAFILGDDGSKTRCSDDGEPSGTAGRPMLDVLTGSSVTNVCVVVTRYFGGTLIGTGGLVRAYSTAVKEGLKNCELIKKISGFVIDIDCDYNDLGKIQYMCAQKGYALSDIEYNERVRAKAIVEDADALIAALTDVTSGRAVIGEPASVKYATLDGSIKIME